MARVMIVDDEPAVLFMLRELLSERGHEVVAADSALAALAIVDAGESESLDLVLSDFAMPGLDGLSLLTKSGEIQPVGSSKVEHVDVRVIACTHRDLAAEVKAGRFREDLYYRLCVVELVMPALRERTLDIPLLAMHFARAAGERFGLEGVALSAELSSALARRSYPGNVRELENVVTKLVALSEGGTLDVSALHESAGDAAAPVFEQSSFRAQIEALEQSLLRRALEEAAGNQSEAARRLSLSRATFLDKLKRHGIG